MDDLNLSDLLRFTDPASMDLLDQLHFDPTSMDDCMQVLFVVVVFFSWWPHTTFFTVLLGCTQIHYGLVPQEADYWNGLAKQAVGTLVISTQLGNLTSILFIYCWSKVLGAFFSTVKCLFVWPLSIATRVAICSSIVIYWSVFQFSGFVACATVRLVRQSLATISMAINGNVDIPDDEIVAIPDDEIVAIPDDEIDEDALDDFQYDSDYVYESPEIDCDLEYDSEVSDGEPFFETDEDASTSSVFTADTPDTAMTPLDPRPSSSSARFEALDSGPDIQ
jgi:hypothetical protein